MNKQDLDECWNVINKIHTYEEGMTLAQKDRVEKALKLAYNKGKNTSKPSLNSRTIQSANVEYHCPKCKEQIRLEDIEGWKA